MDTNNKDVFAVIMAGGSGKRFWPMSRSKHPKQLLALSGEETLITMAVKRLDKFIPKENVLVFTNVEQLEKTFDELKSTGVKREKFYGEPFRRDTAACVGYAAAVIRRLDKDGVMMVLPSDHMILPVDKYQEALGRAVLAAQKGYLVTIGVKPKYPATGYGYIQKNNPLKTVENAFTVKAFKEKPDVETAQKFLEGGDYYWNCGIFVWKASEILKAMENLMPKLHKNMEIPQFQ